MLLSGVARARSLVPQGNRPDSGSGGGGSIQKDNKELVISTDYNDGIRLGIHRLDQLISSFTIINGKELYPAFDTYIATMREIANWNPGFLDGIYETVIRLKTYSENDKKPKEILREIKEHFKQVNKKIIHNTLTDEQRIKRRELIGMLASNFHPDSFLVKALGRAQQKEKEEIFKTKISPAIEDDSLLGLVKLKQIAKDYGIDIE